MASGHNLQALVMSRMKQERTLVFGTGRLAQLVRQVVGDNDVIVVAEKMQAKTLEKLVGVQYLKGKSMELIEGLVAESSSKPGVDLILHSSRLPTVPALESASVFAVWERYLAPSGRIVMQLARDLVDLGEGYSMQEDWQVTVRRYRRVARVAGMRLTQINGFPCDGQQSLSQVTTEDLRASLQEISHTAALLAPNDPESAMMVRLAGEAWQAHFDQFSLEPRNPYGYWHPLDRHLDRQGVLFATFQKDHRLATGALAAGYAILNSPASQAESERDAWVGMSTSADQSEQDRASSSAATALLGGEEKEAWLRMYA